jgi:hypothetical protein
MLKLFNHDSSQMKRKNATRWEWGLGAFLEIMELALAGKGIKLESRYERAAHSILFLQRA